MDPSEAIERIRILCTSIGESRRYLRVNVPGIGPTVDDTGRSLSTRSIGVRPDRRTMRRSSWSV
jgi:hypothetical protein